MNEAADLIITVACCVGPIILFAVVMSRRRAPQVQAPAPRPRRQFHTKVVGVTHGNRQQIIKRLKVGQAVELRLEPDNPVDPYAIAVYVGGKQIGYLSADLAEDNQVDGWVGKATAVVSDLTGGKRGKETRGVNLEISL